MLTVNNRRRALLKLMNKITWNLPLMTHHQLMTHSKYAKSTTRVVHHAAMTEQEESLCANNSNEQPPADAAVEKSKNQLKNEAKRAEKLAKLQQKQAKLAASAATETSSSKSRLAKAQKTASNDQDEVDQVTPPGTKKDMSRPMADSYNPKLVEAGWNGWWCKEGFFKPEYFGPLGSRPVYSIIMPPPNVTGSLHLGHSLMVAVEDALVRWQRMKGKAVLYLPGCDHAGIATQVVVEKKLQRDRKLTRQDLGREAFIQEVWAWKEQYGNRIYEQFHRLGTSVDWDRACFTLDPKANEAVNEAFVRMFDDGLITRASRLVHWSGKLKTAISDLELENREISPNTWLTGLHGHDPKKSYEFGVMTSIAYPVHGGGSDEEILISTTRPETVFADTAVAVNPRDERYFKFHGRQLVHPVLGHLIPVILDEIADPAFGTGALKISPAHDHADFAVGRKHGLPFVQIFTEDNKLNSNAGSFAGMARFEAREAVIEHVKAKGLFRGQSPHAMVLPFCSRSGDIVEPRMLPQWWVNCNDMARRSVEAVRSGELKIMPEEHERVWYHWLENIRDWCISRQLWWGHRIPAYQVKLLNEPSSHGQEGTWVAARTAEEALEKATRLFPNHSKDQLCLEQDPDVLDTWFSSGLWPLTTMGWPKETPDMAHFYPQALLETGSDILFFWVARMVMMSVYLTGKIPFAQVYLHPIVRDAHGRKMSKSLGNVIDPLDVIEGISLEQLQGRLDEGNLDAREVKRAKEGQKADFPHGIPQCGTDALRFGLCSYVGGGRDINLNVSRIETYRRFCNKLWNACRFALQKLGEGYVASPTFLLNGSESPADRWILGRLAKAIRETEEALETYNLMAATLAIYNFWQYELCDVYIEVVKPICAPDYPNVGAQEAAKAVLYRCLEEGLRLLHPFMPFVTEELYQRLPRRLGDALPSISVTPYPTVLPAYTADPDGAAAQFERLNELVKAIRSLASEKKCPKSTCILVKAGEKETALLLRAQEPAMASLVRAVGMLKIAEAEEEALPFNLPEHSVSVDFKF